MVFFFALAERSPELTRDDADVLLTHDPWWDEAPLHLYSPWLALQR